MFIEINILWLTNNFISDTSRTPYTIMSRWYSFGFWRRPAWSAAEQCRTSGASVSRIPDSKFYNEDRSTSACPWSDEGSPCPRRSWTLMSCTRAWMKRAGNKVPRSSLAHHASSSSQKDDAWIFRAWPWECIVGVMSLRVDKNRIPSCAYWWRSLQHSPRRQGQKWHSIKKTNQRWYKIINRSGAVKWCVVCNVLIAAVHHMGVIAVSQLTPTLRAKILCSTRLLAISMNRRAPKTQVCTRGLSLQ